MNRIVPDTESYYKNAIKNAKKQPRMVISIEDLKHKCVADWKIVPANTTMVIATDVNCYKK